MVDGKPILQIIAFICTVIWMSMIFQKGRNDVSNLIKENPDNWGPALGQYLFDNLAGYGGEKLRNKE